MNSILFFNEKLLIIFLSFHIIQSLNSTLYFDYPYYLTLSNDNIFFIHYKGIDIYDSSFNKINQIIQFSGEEEMTEENFSKIKIKYDNKYILSIINDKIYIFNNEGKFLYKSEDKINNTQNIQCYALTSIGLYNDTLKYAIGFFDNKKCLNMLLYSYNITENNNTLLSIEINEYYYYSEILDNRRFSIYSRDLSCEYMSQYNSKYESYSNVFTCFFINGGTIGTLNYLLSHNRLFYFSSIYTIFAKLNNGDDGETFIKSEINNNRTLAFIWFHFSGKHRTYFTIFNANSNTFEIPGGMSNCSSEIYKTKINKFPESNGLVLTYEINGKEIKAKHFNNIDNIKYNWSSFEINASCENINGPAIFYYNNNKNYYIYYCFKNCSDEFYKNDSYCLNLERKRKIKKIIIYIIIAIIVIIILVISIFLLMRYFRKSNEQILAKKWEESQKDEKIMNDILTELLPNNN